MWFFSGCRPVAAEANGGRPIVSRAALGNQGMAVGFAPAILLAALLLGDLLLAGLLLGADPALAGPPFATDDPEPTDTGHWEDYLFSQAVRADHMTSGTALGLEVNYGAAPDLQTSITIPLNDAPDNNDRTQYGPGPVILGVKYRFIEEDDDGWRPQVSFYPSINVPLDIHEGTTKTQEYFPIWAQKSFGAWTTFGGGGYWINPGTDDRDYWFAGWALLRRVLPDLQLGAEIFHQTPNRTGQQSQTSYNGAFLFDLNDNWHIAGSAGSGIVHATTTNQFSYYFALEWTK
jgi:hypothetical protein